MTWGLIVGGGIATVGSYLSNKSSSKALRKAGDAASLEQSRLLDLQNTLLEEGRPLREAQNAAALEATKALQADVLREPGESPLFKRGLTAGTKGIFSALAPFGLSDSSVSAGAVGELAEGLTARELENIRGGQFKLAGLSRDTLGPALGLGGQISSAGTDVGNIALGQGLSQKSLIGDITDIGTGLVKGGTFSNIANLFGRNKFGTSGAGDIPTFV